MMTTVRARVVASLQVLELVFANVGSWSDLDEMLSLLAGKALVLLEAVNSSGNSLEVRMLAVFADMTAAVAAATMMSTG